MDPEDDFNPPSWWCQPPLWPEEVTPEQYQRDAIAGARDEEEGEDLG